MDRPLLLISNDDGYEARGVRCLVDMLRPLDVDLLVCAPDGPRSGYSCAFSAASPLRLEPVSREPGVEVWRCSGTPVDCVKLAIDQILDGRLPDMVIGGINHGDNSTVNNHYSGLADLSPLTPYVQRMVSRVLAEGLPKGVCLNVNFPKGKDFLGVRLCRMTFGRWINEVDKRHHGRGYNYYWMIGEYHNDEPDAEDTDQWALNHHYVAITPTKMDVTDYEMIKKMKDWEE